MTWKHASNTSVNFSPKEIFYPNRPIPAVIESLDLAPLDWMTIRDLLELGDIKNDEPLVAILALLLAATREGSLCLELTDTHIGRLVGCSNLPQIKMLIDQWQAQKNDNQYTHLIAQQGSKSLPLILETVSRIDRLYFQKYYLNEKRLRRQIDAFLTIDCTQSITPQTIKQIVREIYSQEHCLRVVKDGDPLIADTDQIAAIERALAKTFTIVSGGPGTGKTSVMVNILRGLIRIGINPERIALAAPTGRAAQRMTEAVVKLLATIRSPSEEDQALANLRGSTIHKWLRYSRRKHDFYYHAKNPLPVDAVIIDEVSMVDVVMLAKCLDAINPKQTRLVLMGDKDQLPSVEAGAVFAEMIPRGERAAIFEEHLVVLQQVYRSGREIRQLALTINKGEVPDYEAVSFKTGLDDKTDRWCVITPVSPPKWQACLQLWAQYYFATSPDGYIHRIRQAESLQGHHLIEHRDGRLLLKQLFKDAGRAKILTLLRRGPFGCNQINDVIADYFATHLCEDVDPTTGLFSGHIIMVTHNDYAKDLLNGDMGIVIGHRDAGFRAYFQHGDEFQDYAVGQLPPWEPAFAVTVHKSQGSEFDDVLLVLPDDPEQRLLSSEIIYTGITRARKKVIIYGSQAVLRAAASRKIIRQSGLIWEMPINDKENRS